MPSDLSICQAALTRIGATPIASLDDPGAEGVIAANSFALVKRAVLALHPWRFALATAALTRLADTPFPPWDAAWQTPNEALRVWNIREPTGGNPVEFTIQGDTVLTRAADSVIADYVWDAPSSAIDTHVEEVIVLRLAAIFARAVADRETMADALANEAEIMFRRAKNIDSQGQTPQRIRLGRYRSVR